MKKIYILTKEIISQLYRKPKNSIFFRMNFKKLKKVIVIFVITPFFILPFLVSLFSILPQVLLWHPYILLELVLLFIITFIIESFIISIFLKPNKFKEDSKKFYKSVFAVNLVTFPLTQLFAFFLYRPNFIDLNYFLFFCIAIEAFPLLLECLLNLKIYGKFNDLHYFEYRVNNMIIIKATISANLASFAIGFAIFLIF